jgi:D-3-phosphoglycerate dehydrogenase / 2-oxoglutarate reductase
LVTDRLEHEGLALLRQKTDVEECLHLSASELASIIPPFHALIVRSGTQVTESILAAGKNLIVVGRAGVGVDNIDVDAATRRGITVVNAPTTNTVAAAEHTIALMLALARKIPQAERSIRAGEWQRDRFVGTELVGKRLGLVGLGRVGSEVARRAMGLGMQVVAFDPYVPPERAENMKVELVTLQGLLSTCDFISLHTSLTSETKKLIGPTELSTMKRGARLINVARGALVDERALVNALDAGTLAGAALDVFEHEPLDNPWLLQHERVVLTPHLGGSTEESQTRISVEIAEEVLAALENRPTRYAVNALLVPSSLAPLLRSYIDLAERLGKFYIQWVGGPLDSIEVEFSGDIAREDTSILEAAVIKGLLESIHDDRVNLVNAQWIAQVHGLRVVERKTPDAPRYDNLIALKGTRRAVGTVLMGQPHIVQLDGYWVDFAAAGILLMIRHRDRPGMIGKVGTVLGRADVNIASMQVARDAPRGEAIMVLNLDDSVPETVFEEMRSELDIEWAKVVQL